MGIEVELHHGIVGGEVRVSGNALLLEVHLRLRLMKHGLLLGVHSLLLGVMEALLLLLRSLGLLRVVEDLTILLLRMDLRLRLLAEVLLGSNLRRRLLRGTVEDLTIVLLGSLSLLRAHSLLMMHGLLRVVVEDLTTLLLRMGNLRPRLLSKVLLRSLRLRLRLSEELLLRQIVLLVERLRKDAGTTRRSARVRGL